MISTRNAGTDYVEVQRKKKVDGALQAYAIKNRLLWRSTMCPWVVLTSSINMWLLFAFSGDRKSGGVVFFLDLIDVACVNAYILFKKFCEANPTAISHPKRYEQVHFRKAVVRQIGGMELYEDPPSTTRQGRKRKRVRTDEHIPSCTSSSNRRNCVVCFSIENVERKTRFSCKGCTGANGRPIAVCITEERNCFEVYHSERFDSHR